MCDRSYPPNNGRWIDTAAIEYTIRPNTHYAMLTTQDDHITTIRHQLNNSSQSPTLSSVKLLIQPMATCRSLPTASRVFCRRGTARMGSPHLYRTCC